MSRPERMRPATDPGEGTLTLLVEGLAAGGDGVAHAPDGRVVFVPFTAPGDRVRVAIGLRRARYLRGEVVELLEAGPGRTDPLCPVFGVCGGCDWQHLAYETQLEAKRTILRDAIERIAHLPVPAALLLPRLAVALRLPEPRARVGGARAGRLQAAALPRGVRDLALPRARAGARRAAGAPRRGAAPGDGRVGAQRRERRQHLRGARPGARLGRLGGGRGARASGCASRPGPSSRRTQALREPLAHAVSEAAGHGALCLELFAGAGLFTLPLARRFERVVAVESNPGAVADLEENLAAAGLGEIEIVAQAVEEAFESGALASLRPDAVVLDPPAQRPRARSARRRCTRLAAPRVVYVSCDPATLARDVAVLADRGYELVGPRGLRPVPPDRARRSRRLPESSLRLRGWRTLRARSGRGAGRSAPARWPSGRRACASGWCGGPRRSCC